MHGTAFLLSIFQRIEEGVNAIAKLSRDLIILGACGLMHTARFNLGERIGTWAIDISAFASDSGQRDNFIRRNNLESAKFPLARFKPTAITGLPSTYKEGDELKFKMTGDMTVRETTIPVTFDVAVKLAGGKLTGTATADVKMTDFKFNPPDIAGTLKADNEVKLKLEFVAMP